MSAYITLRSPIEKNTQVLMHSDIKHISLEECAEAFTTVKKEMYCGYFDIKNRMLGHALGSSTQQPCMEQAQTINYI